MLKALFIWGIIQSLLVSILIPVIKKAKSNYLLSSIFFTTTLNILFQYILRFTNVKFDFPKLLITPDVLDLVLPTLLYIYLVRIFNYTTSIKQYTLLLLPSFWGVILFVFVISTTNFRFYSYINTDLHLISQVLIFIWKLYLLIKISRFFNFSQKTLKNKQKELLQWPRTLIIFMGLITLVSFFNLAFFIFRKSSVDLDVSFTALLREISNFDYIIFTCFIIFISTYFFIRHPRLLAGFSSFKWNKKTHDIKKFNDLSKKLKAGEKERLFLDTELTESGLAEKLGVKSYLLSKFLNERLGKTFNQFINENRIDEARKMLEKKENEDLTMFAIAVDSGFKSESSFYSNFKKYTGMTPKQYKTKFMNS